MDGCKWNKIGHILIIDETAMSIWGFIIWYFLPLHAFERAYKKTRRTLKLKETLVITAFYRQGNWGSAWQKDWPVVTQLVKAKPKSTVLRPGSPQFPLWSPWWTEIIWPSPELLCRSSCSLIQVHSHPWKDSEN